MQDNGEILAQARMQREAIAINDGLFKDQYGPAAWVIEGSSLVGRLVGAVIPSGASKDDSD
jgi:hypothetical protein